MIWIFLCILLSVVASDLIVHKLAKPWFSPEIIVIVQQMPPDIPIELRNKLIAMIESNEVVEPLDLSYQLEPNKNLPDVRTNVSVDLVHSCPSSRLPEISHRR